MTMYCPYEIISAYYDGWALGIYCALDESLHGFTSTEMYLEPDYKTMIAESIMQFVCPYNETCSIFYGYTG